MSRDYLAEIYNNFEPFRPPPKEAYVDCKDVRGGWEVIRELGRKIVLSKGPTCQLYSGHRGVGKSTELLRLREYLESKRYFVVYFAADDEDIEPQDAQYADILFACARRLAEAVRPPQRNPLLDWLHSRWESLKDLALTEVSLDNLGLEAQLAQFGRITASVRTIPDKRREMRARINANTPSLVEALNDFIKQAREALPNRCRDIVLIADNLDRIVEIRGEPGQPSNYEEIYLNRSEILRGLACHVIYTVPIAMVYSGRGTELENSFDKPDVLPMVMVCKPDGSENPAGLDKLRELIAMRIKLVDPELVKTLEGPVPDLNIPPIFDSPETLKLLCLMSGGHVRILVQLVQKAIDWIDELPITRRAVNRAIEESRETYMKTIQEHQWDILARACRSQQANNDEEHMRLLLNRCLLEYRFYDEDEKLCVWCNVHPLIEGLPKFQSALNRMRS
jgi:hypothetical protein